MKTVKAPASISNVAVVSTAELVAFYNARNPSKPVKKFQDRATAERRVQELLDAEMPKPSLKEYRECSDLARAIPPNALAERNPERLPLHKMLERDGSFGASRAAAIAASWAKPEVAAARASRHHVIAMGVEYRSTQAAFRALKLPMSKMIPVRMELKAKGAVTFNSVKFKLVEAA